MVEMQSLPDSYRAVVIGSTGGIGAAFVDSLEADKNCSEIIRFSRSSNPAINFDDEDSIAKAAQSIDGEIHLLLDATGFLSDEIIKPEKTLRTIDPAAMGRLFEINTIGPALLMKHFMPLLPKSGSGIFATLSARVGSIGDNELGGWYSYRASKAALNMLVKCASVELARKNSDLIVTALHPGTVETSLSDPFAGKRERLKPQTSAQMLLEVLDHLQPEDTGSFWDHRGERIEW